MKVLHTKIDGLIILEPDIYTDDRGYFFESYNVEYYKQYGITSHFVQDNQSQSSYGVIRGLHAQKAPYAQSKLVRVLQGRVLDIAVDIRKNSPTFGEHVSILLSEENKRQFFIPKGFLHGFSVLTSTAVFFYKCDAYYNKEHEIRVHYDDPTLDIDWQIPQTSQIISEQDSNAISFTHVEPYNT